MNSFIYFAFILFLISSCNGVTAKNTSSINNKSKPLVTFVFDDGNETDYTVARDIFSSQGEVACTAVVTNWVNTKNYLSVSQLAELQKDGWEILSHTESHPNLKTLSGSQVEAELSKSKSILENLGLTIKNLVYPYNKTNETVKKIAAKYYRSGRDGGSMLNPYILDRYELKSYSIKHDLSKMKSYIDNAHSEKKWLIFYHHQIDAKIKISDKNGNLILGENLFFQPSGAKGKYTASGIAFPDTAIYFTPLSGIPHADDTITGQTSGATGKLDRVIYNEKEDIKDMIEYIHTNYPEMKIVTIDKGLDFMEIP
ncbi:MAG: polysaccharide deacetylase family protein [Nitrospirae bacterium]|nr:polysaccharide deacetylase family protein [Nitrospirota bacterium]